MHDTTTAGATRVLTIGQATAECRRHHRLDASALAALAPTAADGHHAHLAAAEHGARRDLVERRNAGMIATTFLVGLAEPLIRSRSRIFHMTTRRSPVIGADDIIAVARAAAIRGIWAYRPDTNSGPHYLRAWIDEHLKRELAPLAYAVSIPAQRQRTFQRITAARSYLAACDGREPSDAEILRHSGRGTTQSDIEDEFSTRLRRRPAAEIDSAIHLSDPAADTDYENVETLVGPMNGWHLAMDCLGLDSAELEIIARHVGLPPYQDLDACDRMERAIARQLGLSRRRVRNVLAALHVLRAPDSPLRELLGGLTSDDIEGLGFARILSQISATPSRVPGPPSDSRVT